ncbi:MAG: hypothetical protein CVU56_23980 [Deltaproteobacteria bacterium HGW-Deltaproteobacteria-14]|jgi:hypothetical protein|nr:MAG: hypothetical protein CVU56_23980 [Deltaproteobacteria bacterium HGW-Deltaproteobacteria-14]
MLAPPSRSTILACFALFAAACDGEPATTGAADTAQAVSDAVEAPPDTATAAADTAAATSDPDTTSAADTGAPPADTADTGAPADTSGPVAPPPIVATSSTGTGEWTMGTGVEKTKCVVKRLDNAEEMWVSQVRTDLGAGSHHMIVYITDATEERAAPFDCDPFVETLKGQTFPLMITQIKHETLTFPPGVAFRFAPHQMVRIEAHFINYFPDDISAHGEVHFDAIAADRVTDEANLLFYGNPDFEIPAGQSYTTPWRFIDVPAGTKIFAVTGHEHQLGEDVEIRYADGPEDEGQPIYPTEDDPFTWDEPPVEYFDPPLAFAEGQGVRYRCTWDNPTDKKVGFGESANSEMCFLWAYYYPSQGYRLCVNPGEIGGGVAGDQVCCPGHWVCDYITQFL